MIGREKIIIFLNKRHFFCMLLFCYITQFFIIIMISFQRERWRDSSFNKLMLTQIIVLFYNIKKKNETKLTSQPASLSIYTE